MHAGWDQHNSLTTELYTQCKDTDQPSAALVADLKRLGMLDDTLVLWGGSSGGRRSFKGRSTTASGGAGTTTRMRSRSGWPAAG